MNGLPGLPRTLQVPGWVLLLSLISLSAARAQSVTYQGGASYSRGTYVFTEPTNSFLVSNGLSLDLGRVSFTATLPVIVQNSGIVSFVAGRPLPTGGSDAGAVARRRKGDPVGTRRKSGGSGGAGRNSFLAQDVEGDSTTVVFRDAYETQVGDPLMTGSVEVHSGPGLVRSVLLSLHAKAPIRSVDSGVGTGAWDVGAGMAVAAGTRNSLLMVDLSYWSFGDLPELELESGVMWGVSLSRSFSGGRLAVSGTCTGASAIVESMDSPVSVGLGVLVLPGSGRSLSASVQAGLTESAPDVSVSVGWSLRVGG